MWAWFLVLICVFKSGNLKNKILVTLPSVPVVPATPEAEAEGSLDPGAQGSMVT